MLVKTERPRRGTLFVYKIYKSVMFVILTLTPNGVEEEGEESIFSSIARD